MQQDCQIHKEVAMLNIVEIIFHILVNQEGAIAAQLPQAGKAGLYLQPLSLAWAVYCSAIKGISGRGPTSDILPCRTFKS